MLRHRVAAGALLAALWLLSAGAAHAVIEKLTDLSDILAGSTGVLTARVESLDAGRPAMVLTLDRILAGKAPFKKLPVLIKGDAGAVKRKEPTQLLERLR